MHVKLFLCLSFCLSCISDEPMVFTFCTQVNEKIVVLACVLDDVEHIEERNSKHLDVAVDCLKDGSGINSESWDLLKLATALMMMFCPEETSIDDREVIFCRKYNASQLFYGNFPLIHDVTSGPN